MLNFLIKKKIASYLQKKNPYPEEETESEPTGMLPFCSLHHGILGAEKRRVILYFGSAGVRGRSSMIILDSMKGSKLMIQEKINANGKLGFRTYISQ